MALYRITYVQLSDGQITTVDTDFSSINEAEEWAESLSQLGTVEIQELNDE